MQAPRHRLRLPGRSAKGLQRAALLGLDLLGQHHELQAAIRTELRRHTAPSEPADAGRTATVVKAKRAKLLDAVRTSALPRSPS